MNFLEILSREKEVLSVPDFLALSKSASNFGSKLLLWTIVMGGFSPRPLREHASIMAFQTIPEASGTGNQEGGDNYSTNVKEDLGYV